MALLIGGYNVEEVGKEGRHQFCVYIDVCFICYTVEEAPILYLNILCVYILNVLQPGGGGERGASIL